MARPLPSPIGPEEEAVETAQAVSAPQPTPEPLPTSTPAAEVEPPAPTEPPPPAAESDELPTPPGIVYVVADGDTLFEIALRYGLTVEALAAANQLPSADLIQVGQRLFIPADGGSIALTQAAPPAPLSESVRPQVPFDDALLYSCPENTAVYPLPLPGDPIQLLVMEDQLLMVADGALYGVDPNALASGQPPVPVLLSPPDQVVGNYRIRELVSMTADPLSGDLLLLDKTNDVFRYTRAGGWAMEIPAQPVPGQFPDPQFLTIQVKNGAVLALDADLSHIWQISPQRPVPAPWLQGSQFSAAVDMALVQDESAAYVYLLSWDGAVRRTSVGSGGQIQTTALPVEEVQWPSQIYAENERLVVVDGEARSVRVYDRASMAQVGQVIFRHSAMPRLRSVGMTDDAIYAVAGRSLYVAAVARLGPACAAVVYDNTFYFDGIPVRALLPDPALPFPNTVLPMRPRSYPGARRLYRFGLHEGLDIYGLEAPGLRIGSPVQAVAAGTVKRIDSEFVEMTPQQYETAMSESRTQHRTSEQWMDRLVGRQVHIAHSDQVYSRYGHLSGVTPGLAMGDGVEQGAVVGTVGVSGTSSGAYGTSGGAHLHFEIWVNGRYLGQGLNLYETMRLWQELFR